MSAPQNYDKYKWKISDRDSHVYQRYAAGVERFEDFLNRYVNGQQNLFFAVTTSIPHPKDPVDVLRAARHAWVALRYKIPMLAGSTTQDAQDDTLMTYRLAVDLSDAEAWAERTAQLYDAPSLDDARVELGKQAKLPDTYGQQTFLYIVPRSATEYGILLFTHHTPFDGTGIKMVMDRFLVELARYLDDEVLAKRELSALEWGKEGDNLMPCYTEIVSANELLSGPEYDRTLSEIMQGVGASMPVKHGYKTRGEGPGICRRMEHRYTKAESDKIIAYSKKHSLTVNQLVQSAVFLSALRDNPEVQPGGKFCCWGLVNCRSLLVPPYNERGGYPAHCLGATALNVPIDQVDMTSDETQVLSTAGMIKQQYALQKSYPALLGASAQMCDQLIAFAMAGPAPPPWMGPWYAGDGIGEATLDHVYKDSNGKELVHVEDFFTSLKQHEPGPYFRSYSWGGRLILSVDYNDSAMPEKETKLLMQYVIDFLSVAL